MADISKITLPNGKEYDFKVYADHIAPMISKTFKGVIGTANDFANATFYYGSIRPWNWYEIWGLKYRIRTFISGMGFVQVADVQLYGDQEALETFSSFNSIGDQGPCAYSHSLYRLTREGYDNRSRYGHALGVSIRNSIYPLDENFERTFVIDILETFHCTFTFFDQCLKYSNIPGTGSTNYNAYSEIDYRTSGLQEPISMTILSYGHSSWDDFIAAYNTNTIVYCRASSNANPATGLQTRMAFMAYVNNEDNPTNVEFQYYRSVSSHSNTQQGDQVYVYKLDKDSGWSVIVRQAYTKVIAGTGLTSSYANSAITLKAVNPLPDVTSTDNGKILMVKNDAWAAVDPFNGAKDITFATKQESLNHVVASKTQPSNQQAGDIWLIIK